MRADPLAKISFDEVTPRWGFFSFHVFIALAFRMDNTVSGHTAQGGGAGVWEQQNGPRRYPL